MGTTSIEWTDKAWPVLAGCTRVSEGCRNCYSERLTATRLKHVPAYQGLAAMKHGDPRWTGEVRPNLKVLEDPLRWKKPCRIFVSQMSDLFHEAVPLEFIAAVFQRMAMVPRHTFQVLTKRPERMYNFATGKYAFEKPLPNVWLCVSVEDQATAEERIPLLLQTPAAVRGVSYEPALGPVDFVKARAIAPPDQIFQPGASLCNDPLCYRGGPHYPHEFNCRWGKEPEGCPGIDWVICGGESGPNARPMHPDWARSVRDQCKAAGVAFFFKQGSQANWPDFKNFESFPKDLQIREYPKLGE